MQPHWGRRYQHAVGTVLLCAALAGCNPESVAQPAVSAAPTVPDVAGKSLDVAKSTLQAVGFAGHSRDVLRDRGQFVDSSWTVCTQDPAPGPAAKGAVVELGVVKDDEACPTAAQVTSTTPAPTTTLSPATTMQPAVAAPRPAPKPAPEPSAAPEPAPEPVDPPADNDSGGSPSVGTVHAGSFCSPAGATGVSSKGKPMVCGPASDGRNRWQGA